MNGAGGQHSAHRTSASAQCRGGAGSDVIVKKPTWCDYPDDLQFHRPDRQPVAWPAGNLAGINRHIAPRPAAVNRASEGLGATVELLAGLNSDMTMSRAVIPVTDQPPARLGLDKLN